MFGMAKRNKLKEKNKGVEFYPSPISNNRVFQR